MAAAGRGVNAVEGVERAIAPAEAEALRGIIAAVETFDAAAIARRAMWGAGVVAFGIAWWIAVGLARFAGLPFEFGLRSGAAPFIAVAGFLVAGLWAHVASRKYKRAGQQAALRDELGRGRVREATYDFVAARRFQEPEHGGLVYFLRAADGRVYCLYDEESQDLGATGGEPLDSPLRPCARMTVVRTPASGHVLARTFSGDALDAGEPGDLLAPTDRWPESDEWCACAWDDLDARFGTPRG